MSVTFDPSDLADASEAESASIDALLAPIEILREITKSDLPALSGRTVAAPQKLNDLKNIAYTHHRVAQLLVKGIDEGEVAAITGYTQSRISFFKQDPAFCELLAYYATQREAVFVDTLERMKALGINALEELQRRLEEYPGKWANREIMEMAELMLLKPNLGKYARQGQGGGSGGVTVNVKFVNSNSPEGRVDRGPLIEGKVL